MKKILIKVNQYEEDDCGYDCRFLAEDNQKCTLFDTRLGRPFSRCGRCQELITENSSLKIEVMMENNEEYL